MHKLIALITCIIIVVVAAGLNVINFLSLANGLICVQYTVSRNIGNNLNLEI